MRFEGNVGEEILGELVATQHPGFYDKPYSFFSQSYEKRPQSTAYMPPGYGGKNYYAGGFNGGRTARFLQMSEELKNNIDIDLKNGIIACWNDESHLNHYLSGNTPTIVLSPAYCYQEERAMPFERKLVALLKNHAELRS
jgi:histo-blood group ABO system transferase